MNRSTGGAPGLAHGGVLAAAVDEAVGMVGSAVQVWIAHFGRHGDGAGDVPGRTDFEVNP